MTYKIGMDIGSTTIKIVVLNDYNDIIYKSYERHQARIREAAFEALSSLVSLLSEHEVQFAMTGSAGMNMAEEGSLTFVQEVFACALAVRQYYPKTDVVVELGGEDAKIIYLQGSLEERMNSTCAGGTGSFIDQMAVLLDVSLEELDALALAHQRLYPIASRCGVFAKSDLQPLINQGVSKADLAASIFQAVVDQTITGLAQGREIKGNVLFLGGPLSFFKGLQLRFKETLRLNNEEACFPELGPYFVALGAALYANENAAICTYEDIMNILRMLLSNRTKQQGLAPLFSSKQEYDAFCIRHGKAKVETKDLQTYQGNAYLGIDGGSTTTKMVLLDEDHNILYQSYQSNQGNPVDIVRQELLTLYDILPKEVHIKASAVTGYGEELIKHAFGIDFGVVETIAHYTAAKAFDPDVDFIIDIGGQDMKCFRIKDHSIDDIILNEACSSGCGSFIETFAKGMGYDVAAFAKMGLFAKQPVNLGSRCTVFMNSSVKEAQKNGASIEDISAGLCISVVKNALYKVIRIRHPKDLGSRIIVQGGTFLNDTILRSFEKELNCDVVRINIAGLMGAYGAALLAHQQMPQMTSFITREALQMFTHQVTSARCGLCPNHCNLTINTFENGRKYIAGNKCERPTQHQNQSMEYPNLYDFKYTYLQNLPITKNKIKVGIPFVLNMFDLLPFWQVLLTQLNFEVVLSDPSSRKLFKNGQSTIPSDTVCFGAKLVHGHILNLEEKGVSFIFYPNMSYNVKEEMIDNHFNCPVVAYYPELIEANMELSTPMISPFVSLDHEDKLVDGLYDSFQKHGLNLTKVKIQEAVQAGNHALKGWRSDIKNEGQKALAFARKQHLPIIVLCGRPYHIDPFIHHGIANLLNELGFVVLSEDSVPRQEMPSINVLNQWTYHARMYQACNYALQHDDVNIVQLVSFGCGIDAITTDEISDILRRHHKLYTQIKIDEIDNLGAARIRLRSLKKAIEERSGYGKN